MHIGDFNNDRVYKSQFLVKTWSFSFILDSNGPNQIPWVIEQNFWTPGSAQGAKFGVQCEQFATLNFVPFWCIYISVYSILTLIGWEKQLPAHKTQTFAPADMGMCKILHIHTFKTHCNAATSLCTFAVNQSHFQWFTWLARINILIRGRVGQGEDLKSHIN